MTMMYICFFEITQNQLQSQQAQYLNQKTLNNYDFDYQANKASNLIQQRESRKNKVPQIQIHSIIPKDPKNRCNTFFFCGTKKLSQTNLGLIFFHILIYC